jgi:putative lipoprotein
MKNLVLPALAVMLIAAGCATHKAPPSGPGATDRPPVVAPPPAPPTRPPQARNLVGTKWHLVALNGREVIDDSKASLIISREGRMGGNTSCNSMFGHATVDGGKISFGTMGSTKMYCGGDGVMEQERRYFDALKQVASWRIDRGRLYLTGRAGKDVLVYEAE